MRRWFGALVFIGVLAAPAHAENDEPRTIGWADLRPAASKKCAGIVKRLRRPQGCGNPAGEMLVFRGMLHLGCGLDTAKLERDPIRIAGYVHPLEFEFRDVRRFFLTPPATYCPHSPPPTPNQLILVESDAGINVSADPVFVTGVIEILRTETDLATAVYFMKAKRIEPATIPDADTEGW